MWTRALPLLVAVLAAIPACADPVAPGEELVIAKIGYYHWDDPRITLPSTAAVGEPVVLRVNSYGGSSCTRKGETRVIQGMHGPVVTPFNYVDRAAFSCTRDLGWFPHEVTLFFEEEGEVRVTVIGREGTWGELLIAHRTIVVHRPE